MIGAMIAERSSSVTEARRMTPRRHGVIGRRRLAIRPQSFGVRRRSTTRPTGARPGAEMDSEVLITRSDSQIGAAR
jgi:hypothetical protein